MGNDERQNKIRCWKEEGGMSDEIEYKRGERKEKRGLGIVNAERYVRN